MFLLPSRTFPNIHLFDLRFLFTINELFPGSLFSSCTFVCSSPCLVVPVSFPWFSFAYLIFALVSFISPTLIFSPAPLFWFNLPTSCYKLSKITQQDIYWVLVIFCAWFSLFACFADPLSCQISDIDFIETIFNISSWNCTASTWHKW